VDSRSLEQIYEDEGVPVRIIEIANATLSNELTFMATMSGIQETTVQSRVQDRILNIPVRVGQRVTEGQVVVTFPTDLATIQ
jgi:multidrug efflux pump subunit AcrA (membrane-fusion protein)